MPIRWKVIYETEDRHRVGVMARKIEFLRITYLKDEMAKAIPNSLGIATFATKREAKKWMEKFPNYLQTKMKIIKVQAHGQDKSYKWVPDIDKAGIGIIYVISIEELEKTLRKWRQGLIRGYAYVSKEPEGTLWYESVTPLE